MTPKRKAYLANCSARERALRDVIHTYSNAMKFEKKNLNNGLLFDEEEISFKKDSIRRIKYFLTAYRHELARLKGAGRVVIPKRPQKVIYRINEELKLCKVGRCNCGANLTDVLHVYCPACGRRILWEKVK